jgi:hypothetical protein
VNPKQELRIKNVPKLELGNEGPSGITKRRLKPAATNLNNTLMKRNKK